MMRFDKTLPTHIDMGYKTIKLVSKEYDREFHTVYGQFEHSDERMVICITGKPETDANTLIHEILHVIYEQYCLDEVMVFKNKKKSSDMVREHDREVAEERVVNSMANGLTEVYKRNPKIATWIMDRLV